MACTHDLLAVQVAVAPFAEQGTSVVADLKSDPVAITACEASHESKKAACMPLHDEPRKESMRPHAFDGSSSRLVQDAETMWHVVPPAHAKRARRACAGNVCMKLTLLHLSPVRKPLREIRRSSSDMRGGPVAAGSLALPQGRARCRRKRLGVLRLVDEESSTSVAFAVDHPPNVQGNHRLLGIIGSRPLLAD